MRSQTRELEVLLSLQCLRRFVVRAATFSTLKKKLPCTFFLLCLHTPRRRVSGADLSRPLSSSPSSSSSTVSPSSCIVARTLELGYEDRDGHAPTTPPRGYVHVVVLPSVLFELLAFREASKKVPVTLRRLVQGKKRPFFLELCHVGHFGALGVCVSALYFF